MTSNPFSFVGIIGTGAMGQGIAQMAAQAGSNVLLFDAKPNSAGEAIDHIKQQWLRLAGKGRITESQASDWQARLAAVSSLEGLAQCDLIVEAIVERLDAKQSLLHRWSALSPQMPCWQATPHRFR